MKTYKVMASMLLLVAGCAGHDAEDENVANRCEALINAPLDTTNTSAVGLCIGLKRVDSFCQHCPSRAPGRSLFRFTEGSFTHDQQ
jgi:hypothetical protein